MTASHAADAATDSDATSEAAPVTDTAAAIAAAKDTAGGNGHTRRRRRFPWPSTFRGRLIATISIAALAMLATVIITQNIIVSQAARQQKNNIVMCTDKDTGELITVYFDKNQTSYDLDLEDAPDAVGSSATAVCSPMLSVQEDTVETSDPESTVTKIEVTHIGKTASALTDSFITMMQFISIGTFIIFAVLSLSKSLMDLAIGNLLRNAIMHNISSGTLDIAARQEHCAIIVTITNSTDETLPDDLMNLKQPFHRGEHSRISAEPGVGLGLSIADAACEAMGATLELDRPDEQSFRATITIASA